MLKSLEALDKSQKELGWILQQYISEPNPDKLKQWESELDAQYLKICTCIKQFSEDKKNEMR